MKPSPEDPITRPYTVAFRCSAALLIAVAAFLAAWHALYGSVPEDTVLGVEISRWWLVPLAPIPVCFWVALTARLKKRSEPTMAEMVYTQTIPMVLAMGFLLSLFSGVAYFVGYLALLLPGLTIIGFTVTRLWALIGPWLLAEEPSPRS